MRRIIRKLASLCGQEIRQQICSENEFHSDSYLRHNARRLEHLASLRITVAGSRVLELGAGIGDHTSYYLDRDCDVTLIEARKENIKILRARYPHQKIIQMDLDAPEPLGEVFSVVHCYGLLYHLTNPEKCLTFISDHCSGILFLETCVSFGSEQSVNLTIEPQSNPTQAFSGTGCRPTRLWVYAQLQKIFPYVYSPMTQPNHEEFPIDWAEPKKHQAILQRAIFVAARTEIKNEYLTPLLLEKQTRS